MLEAMKASPFVRTHEIIGASLFFCMQADGPDANVFLIDFAKTAKMETPITHEALWVEGNHEDGLYIGMGNMISIWESIVADLQQKGSQAVANQEMYGGEG